MLDFFRGAVPAYTGRSYLRFLFSILVIAGVFATIVVLSILQFTNPVVVQDQEIFPSLEKYEEMLKEASRNAMRQHVFSTELGDVDVVFCIVTNEVQYQDFATFGRNFDEECIASVYMRVDNHTKATDPDLVNFLENFCTLTHRALTQILFGGSTVDKQFRTKIQLQRELDRLYYDTFHASYDIYFASIPVNNTTVWRRYLKNVVDQESLRFNSRPFNNSFVVLQNYERYWQQARVYSCTTFSRQPFLFSLFFVLNSAQFAASLLIFLLTVFYHCIMKSHHAGLHIARKVSSRSMSRRDRAEQKMQELESSQQSQQEGDSQVIAAEAQQEQQPGQGLQLLQQPQQLVQQAAAQRMTDGFVYLAGYPPPPFPMEPQFPEPPPPPNNVYGYGYNGYGYGYGFGYGYNNGGTMVQMSMPPMLMPAPMQEGYNGPCVTVAPYYGPEIPPPTQPQPQPQPPEEEEEEEADTSSSSSVNVSPTEEEEEEENEEQQQQQQQHEEEEGTTDHDVGPILAPNAHPIGIGVIAAVEEALTAGSPTQT